MEIRTTRTKTSSKSAGETEDTRERLIKAGREIFAKKGFAATTVKDLADEAGVNVSLISYHFGGKEGLYRTILEEFGKIGLATAQRLLQPPRSAEEFKVKLRIFAEEVFSHHLANNDCVRIIHRDCDLDGVKEMSNNIFASTFVKVGETLRLFFEVAQGLGIVRKDLDPHLAANFFFGSVIHPAVKDHMTERFQGVSIKDPVYREKLLNHIMTCCTQGFMSPASLATVAGQSPASTENSTQSENG